MQAAEERVQGLAGLASFLDESKPEAAEPAQMKEISKIKPLNRLFWGPSGSEDAVLDASNALAGVFPLS